MTSSCANGNELSGSIKGRILFDELTNYQILKFDYVPLSSPLRYYEMSDYIVFSQQSGSAVYS